MSSSRRSYPPKGLPSGSMTASSCGTGGASETRVNSRLAREIDLALPRELNAEQRRELVLEYVQNEFVQRGMIADSRYPLPQLHCQKPPCAHHAHHSRDHSGRLWRKVRDWDRLELLQDARKAWQITANRHLEQTATRHGPIIAPSTSSARWPLMGRLRQSNRAFPSPRASQGSQGHEYRAQGARRLGKNTGDPKAAR